MDWDVAWDHGVAFELWPVRRRLVVCKPPNASGVGHSGGKIA